MEKEGYYHYMQKALLLAKREMELKTIIENKDLQSIQKKELNKLHKKLYVKDSEEIVYKSISKYL